MRFVCEAVSLKTPSFWASLTSSGDQRASVSLSCSVWLRLRPLLRPRELDIQAALVFRHSTQNRTPARQVVEQRRDSTTNRRPDSLGLGSRHPSAVEVTTPTPAVRLRPELPFQLHQAPDSGAVSAEVRLYFGGQLTD